VIMTVQDPEPVEGPVRMIIGKMGKNA